MNLTFRLVACVLLSTTLLLAPDAHAADDDAVRYTVRKGDTLIDLAEKYMTRRQHYLVVQRQNRIPDPYRISTGKVILIPRSLLKYSLARARLASVRGDVLVNTGGNRSKASTGQVLSEGAALSTAASSFATLTLDDGSRISMPSNSDMRISRLRSYKLGGIIDYDFAVTRGGARSKVAPLKSGEDSYRMRSPKAVSAVRGTDFEMRYDQATGADFAEVDEGALAVGTGGQNVALPAGKGLAVSASGAVVQEALLPAPLLANPGKLQADELPSFAISGDRGDNAHRFQIAADAGFVEHVVDVSAEDGKLVLPALPNGNYFIRTREIAGSGIQGLPATYAFKRRLNGIKASAELDSNGYAFKWLGAGEGVRRYHFQLFRGQPDSVPMVDEAALEAAHISISDLPPGDYHWRVGAVQYLEGEAVTNWTAFEKLTAGTN